jgi:Transposase DDE domain
MEVNVTNIPSQLQSLFGAAADKAAQQSQLIKRQRKLTATAFAQGLVFTWLANPQATGDELVTGIARAGVTIKEQSLDDRFGPKSAEFFRLLLGEAIQKVVATAPRAVGLLDRFEGTHLLDGSTISLPAVLAELWPGCGGRDDTPACKAALKVMVRYEVGAGVIEGMSLHPGRTADARTPLHEAELPPGSLRLADLGFFDLDVLRDYGRKDVYYLSRVQANTVVYDEYGRKWKLARYLARQRKDRLDTEVWVGVGKILKCRLLAIRAPQEVADERLAKARQQAAAHANKVSEEKVTLCGWTVFITNVPRWLLNLQEAWVLYRVRWQIELLFKLWKSDGQIDESRSDQPYRVLTEVYAKLLAMVIQHWLLLRCGGGGLGKKSLRKAARAVRSQIAHVAASLKCVMGLRVALTVMTRMVAAAGEVHRRQRRPATFQTMLDPDHDGLSADTKERTNGPPLPEIP